MSAQLIPADLEEARDVITPSDKKLAVCLGDNFRLATTPTELPEGFNLPQNAQDLLDEWHAPHELVTNILKYIDLSLRTDAQLKAITEMTSYLVERYRGVLGVVAYKEERPAQYSEGGVFSSVVPERRKKVISAAVTVIPGQQDAARVIWDKAVVGYSEDIQDNYLNHKTGPLAHTFEQMPWLLDSKAPA